MGQVFSKKKTKRPRSNRYKSPRANFIIIVDSSDTSEKPSISTFSSKRISQSLYSSRAQPSKTISRSSILSQIQPSRSTTLSLDDNLTQPSETVIQSLDSSQTQFSTSITQFLHSSGSLKEYSESLDQSLSASDISTEPSLRGEKIINRDVPLYKPIETFLYKLNYDNSLPFNRKSFEEWRKYTNRKLLEAKRGNRNSDQWEIFYKPLKQKFLNPQSLVCGQSSSGKDIFLYPTSSGSVKTTSKLSNKGYNQEINEFNTSSSQLSRTSENSSKCQQYKTADDFEEELTVFSFCPKNVGLHCKTCQCKFVSKCPCAVSNQGEEKLMQSNYCSRLPQKRTETSESSSLTITSNNSEPLEAQCENLPRHSDSAEIEDMAENQFGNFITIEALETEFGDVLPMLSQSEETTEKSKEAEPLKASAKNFHQLSGFQETVEKTFNLISTEELETDALPKPLQSEETITKQASKSNKSDPPEACCNNHPKILKFEETIDKPSNFTTTEALESEFGTILPKQYYDNCLTQEIAETVFGVVLPELQQSSFPSQTCMEFKKALEKQFESVISKEILHEAFRKLSEQRATQKRRNQIKQFPSKQSNSEEKLPSEQLHPSMQSDQAVLSVPSMPPNHAISKTKQPVQLFPSKELNPEETNVSKQLFSANKSNQVVLSVQSIPPSKLVGAPKQPIHLFPSKQSNSEKEIPSEQSNLLKQSTKSKQSFLPKHSKSEETILLMLSRQSEEVDLPIQPMVPNQLGPTSKQPIQTILTQQLNSEEEIPLEQSNLLQRLMVPKQSNSERELPLEESNLLKQSMVSKQQIKSNKSYPLNQSKIESEESNPLVQSEHVVLPAQLMTPDQLVFKSIMNIFEETPTSCKCRISPDLCTCGKGETDLVYSIISSSESIQISKTTFRQSKITFNLKSNSTSFSNQTSKEFKSPSITSDSTSFLNHITEEPFEQLRPSTSKAASSSDLDIIPEKEMVSSPCACKTKALPQSPSSKFVSLLETKYNKKFNTIDELMLKPPKDLISLMMNGELPKLPATLKKSRDAAINYDDFLNSMRSGV